MRFARLAGPGWRSRRCASAARRSATRRWPTSRTCRSRTPWPRCGGSSRARSTSSTRATTTATPSSASAWSPRAGGIPEGFVLETKVDRDMDTGDFSGDRVRRSVEESLERLGLDRLGLVHLHDPEHISFEEGVATGGPLEALQQLKAEGVIAHLGVAGGPIDLMQRYIRTGAFDVVLTHNRFNLVDQSAEPLLDEAAELGVAVLNAAPFGGGILAGSKAAQGFFAYRAGEREILARIEHLHAAVRPPRRPARGRRAAVPDARAAHHRDAGRLRHAGGGRPADRERAPADSRGNSGRRSHHDRPARDIARAGSHRIARLTYAPERLELRTLGRTGLQVTPLCVGTSPLGNTPHRLPARRRAPARARDAPPRPRRPDQLHRHRQQLRRRRAPDRDSSSRELGGVPDGFVLQTKVDRDMDTGDFSGERVRRSVRGEPGAARARPARARPPPRPRGHLLRGGRRAGRPARGAASSSRTRA